MKRITVSVLALSLVGATSCVAYDDPGYQNPPGTQPEYRAQPTAYQSPQPPPPSDYRGPNDYRDDDQQPYDSRYPGGYDDRYQRSPSYEVGFFYQELSPYGEWVYTYDYGWAWYPRNVRAGWRPYFYGHWVPSDYGWMWVSQEPFGWATYHYGRWAWDHRLGWIWVPGRTWGPAWVSWQSGQGYTGWAPLPPEVGFELGFGLRIGNFSLSVGIQPQSYVFLQDRMFLEPEPYRYALPASRNVTIIQNTTNITNITYVDNRVINRGVDIQQIERATGKRVRPLRVAESSSQKVAKVSGDEVVVYKAPRERIETVQIDDSKPRNKGVGRDRERGVPPGQADKREREPRSQAPATEPRAPRDRSEQRVEDDRKQEQRMRSTPPEDLEVAPRARQEAKAEDEAQVERKQRKEKEELQAYQRDEQRRLDKAQREEKQKARDAAAADKVAKQHADEKKALADEQKQAEQQLQVKQEVERKAVKAKPPGKQKADEKKGKNQDKGKKKPQDEEPPPPHR